MPEWSGVENSELVSKLKDVLIDLRQHPYPYVPNPPDLKKRASVALIIRVNPSYSHWPSGSQEEPPAIRQAVEGNKEDSAPSIESFFSQKWVQHGNPETLFIKRAHREGDKWTGHVALPGGGRDPEDADDQVTAIRETLEEVGIELGENAIAVGNLPQRLVTASWGKYPLMVLCPYVFLIHRHDLPPLRLQPSEVASAHWIPLRVLLSPRSRTFEYQDVSGRLANQQWGLKRLYFRLMFGHMVFSAVRLIPSSSELCSPDADFEVEKPEKRGPLDKAKTWLYEATGYRGTPQPPMLLLWGLTLGVMADFLELLPPHNAVELWTYPTFSSPDLRILIWALSLRFRKRKLGMINNVAATAPASIEAGPDSIPMPWEADDAWARAHPPGSGESGLGVNHEHDGPMRKRVRRGSKSSRIGFMLEGYYDFIRRAFFLALLGRVTALVGFAAVLWYRSIRRRSR